MVAHLRNVTIVGAGIGGLTAALCLNRAGIDVKAFDQQPQLAEAGAGMMLSPNATGCLERLGLGDAIAARGERIDRQRHCTPSGRVLKTVDLNPLLDRLGNPWLGIQRPALLRVLSDALDSESLVLGARCTGVAEEDADTVIAEFDGRDRRPSSILVGADGRDSKIRRRFDTTPLRYAGYTSRRGMSRLDGVEPGIATQVYGRGVLFGFASVGDGQVYWYASQNAPAGSDHDRGGRKRELLARFAGWPHPVEALIDACDESAIAAADISDLPRRPAWGRGRVTLLGDAAHPVSPALGQGACMAIEDGVILAASLLEHADMVRGIRDYERRRMDRTSTIVERSRALGALGSWERPWACAFRNVALHAMPERAARKRLEPIWRFAP